jgi:hypothetical protein|nr:MAG TPA: hypothetical protein [Caudoviricetes sp.]
MLNQGRGEKIPVEQSVVKEYTMKCKTHYSTVFAVLQSEYRMVCRPFGVSSNGA